MTDNVITMYDRLRWLHINIGNTIAIPPAISTRKLAWIWIDAEKTGNYTVWLSPNKEHEFTPEAMGAEFDKSGFLVKGYHVIYHTPFLFRQGEEAKAKRTGGKIEDVVRQVYESSIEKHIEKPAERPTRRKRQKPQVVTVKYDEEIPLDPPPKRKWSEWFLAWLTSDFRRR